MTEPTSKAAEASITNRFAHGYPQALKCRGRSGSLERSLVAAIGKVKERNQQTCFSNARIVPPFCHPSFLGFTALFERLQDRSRPFECSLPKSALSGTHCDLPQRKQPDTAIIRLPLPADSSTRRVISIERFSATKLGTVFGTVYRRKHSNNAEVLRLSH